MTRLSGGCQCGAVRFAVDGTPLAAEVCHCRMCQKAVGNVIWPFVTMRRDDVEWARGRPTHWRSSAAASRGFCSACGTPLTFESTGEDTIDLSIGALDDPASLAPTHHVWAAQMVPWFEQLAALPRRPGTQTPEQAERTRSRQHPDHDMPVWPEPER